MSGGQKINDHSFWAGGKSKDSVFPKGVHTKDESSAEGVCGLATYEDTTEQIRSSQVMADKKVRGHPREHLHRN